MIRLGPGELLAALGNLGCARAARVYAAVGFPVVPMHTARADGRCSCTDPVCPDPGKHPRLRRWQRLAAVNPAVVGEWWRRWPDANLGLATERRFDVLDLDGTQGGGTAGRLVDRSGRASGAGGAYRWGRLASAVSPYGAGEPGSAGTRG
jgi:bifunctional DNA primase/polymerase-like protein